MENTGKYPFEHALSNYLNLFRETKACVHSVKIRETIHTPYTPTYFMYMYFFFNTLYNVKWKESIESGYLILFNSNDREDVKIESLIDFCFSNDEFWPSYADQFITTMLQKNSNDNIKESLKQIRKDKTPNGNFYANEGEESRAIKQFQKDVKELIFNKNFGYRRIHSISKFIYKVRCNIFHGIKCLDEIGEYGQKERLAIYANILMAINEMTLECAKYSRKQVLVSEQTSPL